jgi:DNA-binding response OmpR family regulator
VRIVIIEETTELRNLLIDIISTNFKAWAIEKIVYFSSPAEENVSEALKTADVVIYGMNFYEKISIEFISMVKGSWSAPILIATSGIPDHEMLATEAGADFFIPQPNIIKKLKMSLSFIAWFELKAETLLWKNRALSN